MHICLGNSGVVPLEKVQNCCEACINAVIIGQEHLRNLCNFYQHNF